MQIIFDNNKQRLSDYLHIILAVTAINTITSVYCYKNLHAFQCKSYFMAAYGFRNLVYIQVL